jgi:hypothetical protein
MGLLKWLNGMVHLLGRQFISADDCDGGQETFTLTLSMSFNTCRPILAITSDQWL